MNMFAINRACNVMLPTNQLCLSSESGSITTLIIFAAPFVLAAYKNSYLQLSLSDAKPLPRTLVPYGFVINEQIAREVFTFSSSCFLISVAAIWSSFNLHTNPRSSNAFFILLTRSWVSRSRQSFSLKTFNQKFAVSICNDVYPIVTPMSKKSAVLIVTSF
jgi:hypothetical protein